MRGKFEYFREGKGKNKRKRGKNGRKQIDQAQPSQQPQQDLTKVEPQDEQVAQSQDTK